MFGNTVDRITRGLNSMVSELVRHAEAMRAKAAKHHERAKEEHKKADTANGEANKADKISAKIGDLLK